MLVLVWVFLILAAGSLLLSAFKVTAARVDLQSLGLLFWLAAFTCRMVG